jgi:uncharacterized delta-60 repeat protein
MTAPGIWTLDQAITYIKAGTWPFTVNTYWIGLLGGSNADIGQSVAVDSSFNVYVFGASPTSFNDNFQIAKYNKDGVIQWQKRLGGADSEYGYSVAVDSSGNAYVCGWTNYNTTLDFQIAKYNTSGTLQWQRSLSSGGGLADYAYSVAVDSSSNMYVCGEVFDSSTVSSYIQIAKYNTSGTIQWQRGLVPAPGYFGANARSIAVDSSGNVYICGFVYLSGSSEFQISKYDTSGTIQWQRSLGSTGTTETGYSVAVDSSGNVYVCGSSDTSGYSNIQIAKYNTSGVIQWQRSLGGSGSVNDEGYSVTVDSSGNVYVCGRSNASGNQDIQIAKYNTSGTIQWQRRLGSSAVDEGYSIAVDYYSNLYICGKSNARGNTDFFFAKLPGDGSLTGTYTVGGASITYAVSTLTDAASSLTDAATSLTDSVSGLTDAATPHTDATSSLTSYVTTL